MWGQLVAKALISGAVVAAASELARRSPALGGLVASLPLTALLAVTWLWRDTHDPARVADFITGTACYVAAALPAFVLIAALLRRGAGIGLAMTAGVALALALTAGLIWAGRKQGLPV